MNKGEMIKAIATDAGLTQVDVNKFLISQQKVVAETLRQGGEVQLIGFMTIRPIAKAARTGRNISTDQPMIIPETVGVSMSPGKNLKDAVAELDYADFAK